MILIKTRITSKPSPETTITESFYFSSSANRWEQNLPTTWTPPVDIFEIDDKYIIRMEIAGMNEEDFTIILEKNLLSIRGIRKDPELKRAFHQMEIHYGEFHFEIAFSALIAYEEVSATYENGFLDIALPKAQPRQINIQDD